VDVFEAIQRRRSVRSYLPDPIPKDKLEKILEAARLSPSAGNIQPWHFIVVMDEREKKELSKGMWAKFLVQAPVVIVGCADMKASPKWSMIDTTIGMQSMVLTATSLGFGTCWVGSFNEDAVKKLLDIPEHFAVVALLSIGYARESVDLTRKVARLIRPRKNVEEIFSLDRFGSRFAQ
jgi:nitroreductase